MRSAGSPKSTERTTIILIGRFFEKELDMIYDTLADFITKKMRMSHIYQPVMLMSLLTKGGKCHEREIASDLLIRDESQIEYYTQITNLLQHNLQAAQPHQPLRGTLSAALWASLETRSSGKQSSWRSRSFL